MQEARVLLLRHAETAAPDLFHGAESDVGLGERGLQQAEAVATRMKQEQPVAIYCSGMRRARQTAEPIGRLCQLEPIVVEQLHERKMGPLSGQSKAEGWSDYELTMERWSAGEVDYTHPEGESFAEMAQRVVPRFQEIAARHRGRTSIVVAHGVVIRVLICSLVKEQGPAAFQEIPIDFVGIHDLRWDGSRWWSGQFH